MSTVFMAAPREKRFLNDHMVAVFNAGIANGDVNIVARDGEVLKAHQCVLSISPALKQLFQFAQFRSLTATVMMPDFRFKSIAALLKFIYTGEVELVTGSDVTCEFSELCKILRLNPPVNKYRNHTSKKARSSLTASNPKYKRGWKDETRSKRAEDDSREKQGSERLQKPQKREKLQVGDNGKGNLTENVDDKAEPDRVVQTGDFPPSFFKMPDNFDLPDEIIMDGASGIGYGDSSTAGVASPNPSSHPLLSVPDKIYDGPPDTELRQTFPLDPSQTSESHPSSDRSVKEEDGIEVSADGEKHVSLHAKKSRISHSALPEETVTSKAVIGSTMKVKSARYELDEKRRRMMEKLKREEGEKRGQRLEKRKKSKWLKTKRKPDPQASSSHCTSGKRMKRCADGKQRKHQQKGHVGKPYKSDKWIVTDLESEDSDQWVPSEENETEEDNDISISTSSSNVSDGKTKVKNKKKILRRKSGGLGDFDSDDVLLKMAIKKRTRKRKKEEPSDTDETANPLKRRDLKAEDLSRLVEGGRRNRVRVKVDLDGKSAIIDYSQYKLQLANVSPSDESREKRSGCPKKLKVMKLRLKRLRLKKREFYRIKGFEGGTDESDVDEPEKARVSLAQFSVRKGTKPEVLSHLPSTSQNPTPADHHPLKADNKDVSSNDPFDMNGQKSGSSSNPRTTPSSSKADALKFKVFIPKVYPQLCSYGLSSKNEKVAEKSPKDDNQNMKSNLKMCFKRKISDTPSTAALSESTGGQEDSNMISKSPKSHPSSAPAVVPSAPAASLVTVSTPTSTSLSDPDQASTSFPIPSAVSASATPPAALAPVSAPDDVV